MGALASAIVLQSWFKPSLAPESAVVTALIPESAVTPTRELLASKLSRERVNGASFKTLRALGEDSLHAGKPYEAIEYFKQALQRQLADAGDSNEGAIQVLADVANAYLWVDDEFSAHEAAANAVAIANQLGPALSTERIWAVSVLSDVLIALGEYSAADALITDAFTAYQQHLGSKDSSLLNPICSLALVRFAQGRIPEAERFARDAEVIAIQARGAHEISAANAKSLIAALLVERKAFKEAEQQARAVIEIASRHRSDRLHPYEVSAKHILAEALMGLGEYARAEVQLQEELKALEEARAIDWRVARAASALGEVYVRTDRILDAERYLSLAKRKLTRTKGWPIEREVRNLARRLEELDALRVNKVSALTN
jgi:tetratricopeptide (TPR) repeat protein